MLELELENDILSPNEKKIINCLQNHKDFILVSQLVRETQINYKNIGKYLKSLVEKRKIIEELFEYDKRKKLVKLERLTKREIKTEKWLIRDFIELNDYTINDLKKARPEFSKLIDQVVSESHLEEKAKKNELKAKEREKERDYQDNLDYRDIERFVPTWKRRETFSIYREDLREDIDHICIELANHLTPEQKAKLKIQKQEYETILDISECSIPSKIDKLCEKGYNIENLENFIQIYREEHLKSS